MNLKEYQRMTGQRHKYHNQPTMLDDILFDSKKEAMRYAELKMLEKAGAITDLKRQVPYELQPAFYHKGKRVQAIRYIADFVYTEDGNQVIEDVKSDGTRYNQVYKIKKKMMLYHGWEIKEI